MEHQFNNVNQESLKIGLKIHKGKTKFMTNIDRRLLRAVLITYSGCGGG